MGSGFHYTAITEILMWIIICLLQYSIYKLVMLPITNWRQYYENRILKRAPVFCKEKIKRPKANVSKKLPVANLIASNCKQ